MDNISGNVFKFGDNVDTDVIIPARYLNTSEPSELAVHCMEDVDASFAESVKQGDIIVGGKNFGCGSSREHAPVAIKAAGIDLVIADSFARIFYRNAINVGLPILECPQCAADAVTGDAVTADLSKGIIINKTQNKKYEAASFPPFIEDIIKAGGLIGYIKKKGAANDEL